MKSQNIFANIGAGLTFIFSRRGLLLPLLFLTVAATFAMNFNVLIPVFSEEVLHLSDSGYGILMSMAGVGALTGRPDDGHPQQARDQAGVHVCLSHYRRGLIVVIGLTSHAVMTGAVLAITSFFYMIFLASVNSTMQLNATNEYRGRVMSVYALVVAGSTPLGNLFAGWIAEAISERAAFIACGAVILVLLLPMLLLVKRNSTHGAAEEIGTGGL